MAASILQERETSTGGSVISSLALAFSSNLTAVSSIHVVGSTASNTSISCSDTANGSFGAALDGILNGTSFFPAQFNLDNSASGADTVTTTYGGGSSFCAIWIREIGGTSGIDSAATGGTGAGHSSSVTSSGTTRTIGTITPSTTSGIVSAVAMDSTAPTWTAGSGFTLDVTGWGFPDPGTSAASEHQIYSSSAAITCTITVNNSGTVSAFAIAYKASAGGGGNTASIAWVT